MTKRISNAFVVEIKLVSGPIPPRQTEGIHLLVSLNVYYKNILIIYKYDVSDTLFCGLIMVATLSKILKFPY